MTLTAHAIVGAGVAALIPAHPVLGVCAAFASHFLVDAIPHYDYQIRSESVRPQIGAPMKFDRALLHDFLAIGSDCLLGLMLAVFFFGTAATWLLILIAAFAGQFPDALQFAYSRWKHQPLVSLQKFHHSVHTKRRLREHPMLGITSQIFFIAAVVVAVQALIA